ncbi:MAG: hypothetical protein WCL07_00660 [bacterium]
MELSQKQRDTIAKIDLASEIAVSLLPADLRSAWEKSKQVTEEWIDKGHTMDSHEDESALEEHMYREVPLAPIADTTHASLQHKIFHAKEDDSSKEMQDLISILPRK